MNTEPELLNERLERLAMVLDEIMPNCALLVRDALELLKKQEATMVIESENMYTGLPITHCPKCGKSLDRYLYGRQHEGKINFCPYCGQAVKWE